MRFGPSPSKARNLLAIPLRRAKRYEFKFIAVPKKQKATQSNATPNDSGKSTRRQGSTTARKTAAPKTPGAGRKAKSTKASTPRIIEPTDEEIRLRAYFIAERRHRLDLPGDADSDWLEAKRQLLSELGR
jgi:hypothetical protein